MLYVCTFTKKGVRVPGMKIYVTCASNNIEAYNNVVKEIGTEIVQKLTDKGINLTSVFQNAGTVLGFDTNN